MVLVAKRQVGRIGNRAIVAILVGSTLISMSCSMSSSRWSGGESPSMTLTARPRVGEIPLTVEFLATVQGGSDEEPLLYCADAEWDFGDAKHVDRQDCPPLEDGGVTIRRTYTTIHTYDRVGRYKVRLALLQGDKAVIIANTEVRSVKPGGPVIR